MPADHNLIEVTKAWPQSSHDQAWSIRPWALKRDSSATSSTPPQRGQRGRLRFFALSADVEGAWHSDWTIMVDPPSLSLTTPNRSELACGLWHARDASVKLLWLSMI